MNFYCRNSPPPKKKIKSQWCIFTQRIIAAREQWTWTVRVLYAAIESAVLVPMAGSETDCGVRVSWDRCDYRGLITGFIKAHIKIYDPSSRATLPWCGVGVSLWSCQFLL